MSTGHSQLDEALGQIPKEIRKRVIDNYLDLKHRARTADPKGAASAATAFCETVLRALQQELTGTHIPFGTHVKNFHGECLKLEQQPANPSNESQRLIIPKALLFIHTIRGKRGTGHAAGDVDANTIDLAATVRVADWVIAELIRLHHKMSLEDAQALLDRLAIREIPSVWQYGDTKRVLRTELTKKDQALLILYGETVAIHVETLCEWIEYSSMKNFRHQVIKPLHIERKIECDPETQMIILTPLGAKEVESRLL